MRLSSLRTSYLRSSSSSSSSSNRVNVSDPLPVRCGGMVTYWVASLCTSGLRRRRATVSPDQVMMGA